MPSREQSLDVIATFLRERNAKAEQTLTAIKNLPPEQQAAVMYKGDVANDCQRHYTINELVTALPGDKWLDYAKLRYVLLGADEGVYRNQGQPKALSLKGIVIDYSDGPRKPKFCYDRDIHLAALNGTVAPVEVVEEVKPVETAPAEVTTVVECNLTHVPQYMKDVLNSVVNADDVKVGEDNIIYINGSPLYGMFLASVEWCEANGYPIDVTKNVIEFNETLAVKTAK